jgi:serine/threonine-protein kinase
MESFGDYTLVRPLARGGMAELYFARRRDGGEAVIKRLLPEMESRADVIDLFLTEADIGQLLRHDNVVRVVDAGEVDGHYFLAMEYVDGLDADHLLADAWQRQTPLPTGVALRICVEALRGLHHAHTLRSPQGTHFGLVHRDVSPDNLFVTVEGVTKVADFGIAKLASLEGVTQVGLVKGKLAYMSPEQLRGIGLDGRADGYALALILYEMLSSSRPFAPRDGENEVDHLVRVRSGELPALAALEPELPRGITRAVDKMLRRWRFWRFSHCAAFADALEKSARRNDLWPSAATVGAVVREVRARRRAGGSP